MKRLSSTDQNNTALTNVPTPVSETDAVNKAYADTKAASVNAMGFVNHGSTASTARPTGYASITWYGSVEPTSATETDLWVDTSA